MAEQWHEQAPADMVLLFQTDLSLGLSEKVAEQRLQEVGPNLLSQQKKHPLSSFFCSNLQVW